MSEHTAEKDAGQSSLFDVPPAFVKRDARCGHITLAANPFGQCDGAFVDLGSELHWWAHTPLHLDATGARLLGEHLLAWAEKKDDALSNVDHDALARGLVDLIENHWINLGNSTDRHLATNYSLVVTVDNLRDLLAEVAP